MQIETYQSLSFVPNLGILNSRIRQMPVRDESKKSLIERYIEQLPYNLSAAAYALVRLFEGQVKIFRACNQYGNKKGALYIRQLNDLEWHEMVFEFDGFLEASHRTQNAIWVYISKILSVSTVSSLSKTIKKIEAGHLVLPEEIKTLILLYWVKSGKLLKEYRDLSQHFAVVASDGRFIVMPNGEQYLYLVLPNNPSTKNASALNYENPRIDALPYAVETYKSLYRFICEFIHLLLSYTDKPPMELFALAFKGPVCKLLSPQGTQCVNLIDVVGQIDEIRKKYEND